MRRSSFALLAFLFAAQLFAQDAPMTPDKLWEALLQGNKQYIAGKLTYDKLVEERKLFSENQLPPVTVLSCSDSRVPPELIFNQSLGSLFIVRTAGNTADEFGIASIEFAIANGWTKLIVVMSHTKCGAISASLGGADPGTKALTALATRIRMSFVGIPYDSKDPANVQKATEANARAAAAQLLAASPMIRDAVLTGQVKIVVANYDIATGEVKKIQ
jgi:carbonic anhydrase